jgi:hypothetical protein
MAEAHFYASLENMATKQNFKISFLESALSAISIMYFHLKAKNTKTAQKKCKNMLLVYLVNT